MISAKDYKVAIVTGLLTALFLAGILFFRIKGALVYAPFFFIAIPTIWITGLKLGIILGRRWSFLRQFSKFAVVGFYAASIDFFILNALSQMTGIESGIAIGWINAPGFLIAILNSYLLNRWWVFDKGLDIVHIEKSDDKTLVGHSFLKTFEHFPFFLVITLVGLFLNSAIIIILTTYVKSDVDSKLLLNVAKIIASAVVMVWDFLGYKLIAFRSPTHKN